MIELWESGLPPFWVRNHTPQAPQCFAKIKPRTRQIAIRLIDLLGAFLIFILGVSLAALAFVIELVLNCSIELRYMPNVVVPARGHVDEG